MESNASESLAAREANEAQPRADDLALPPAENAFEPPKISFGYRLSLVVVSLAMILLPVVYLALVGFCGWAVWYYAAHNYSVLNLRGGLFFKVLIYFGPVLSGAVMVFFLIKPIFAPRAEEDEPYSLNHADAPQLFALIGWICRALQAPIPSRIDVDLSPNAGAGFRSGVRSMFGNDIRLLIGLPLIAGLNLNQFAGVIAHEYGHFSQGTAMRASYLIRQINAWFFRVVYLRDAWDVALIEASESGGFMVMLFGVLARLGVWFGRTVLWVLMMIGHALSCFLERQMEFDADRYEVKMSGTQTFFTTTRRLQQLNLGVEVARKQLRVKWRREQKLFDQLPEFIVSRADEIPAEIQGRHLSHTFKRKTRLFDTHPSDAERVQRAVEANEPGVIHSTAPATSLFTDFAEFSRRATIAHYQNLIGPEFSESWLISTEETVRGPEHDNAADKQNVQRYFLGLATSLRPIIVTESKTLSLRTREPLMAEIAELRQRMESLAASAQPAFRDLKDADGRLLRNIQATQLLQAGFSFNPADFGLTDPDLEHSLAEARRAVEAAGDGLREFEEAGRTRLMSAIQLLRITGFGAGLPNIVQLKEETHELVFALTRLGEVFGPLLEVRRDCAALGILLRYRDTGQRGDHLSVSLERLAGSLQEHINQIQQKLAQLRYPFEHTTEQILVVDYARNRKYHPDPLQMVLREGESHVEKLIALYYRLLSRIILIAEQVERTAFARGKSSSVLVND